MPGFKTICLSILSANFAAQTSTGSCDDEPESLSEEIRAEGEIVIEANYEEHRRDQGTRDAVRREEVNINHSREDRERDSMGDFTL